MSCKCKQEYLFIKLGISKNVYNHLYISLSISLFISLSIFHTLSRVHSLSITLTHSLSLSRSRPLSPCLFRLKDIDNIDTTIPMNLNMWIPCVFSLLSTLVVITISVPMFILVIIPLSLAYYLIQVCKVTTFSIVPISFIII